MPHMSAAVCGRRRVTVRTVDAMWGIMLWLCALAFLVSSAYCFRAGWIGAHDERLPPALIGNADVGEVWYLPGFAFAAVDVALWLLVYKFAWPVL